MQWILKIAWKNCWRNPGRTLISMASVFFAIILSILAGSLKEGIFNNLVNNVVGFYSGYIQVHKQGYWNEQNLDNSIKDDSLISAQIRSQDNIRSLAPRIESFALAASNKTTKGALIIGINPEAEHITTSIKNKIVGGEYINPNEHAVLCSEGMANRLAIGIHDTIYMIGQGYHGAAAAGKYVVKGIVHFGSPELNDQTIFLPIQAAKELFSTENNITSYVIQIHNPQKLTATKDALQHILSSDYEIMTWEEMMPDIKQHIETDSNNMKYVQGILYLLICFGILGTLIMMMMERKYEMGMLIAIGMKKIQLIYLVMAESLITIISGCILGMLCSIPIVYYLHIHPIRMGGETAKAYEQFGFEAIFPTSTNPTLFIEQAMITAILGIMLCLYPIIQIIRFNPVEALKKTKG